MNKSENLLNVIKEHEGEITSIEDIQIIMDYKLLECEICELINSRFFKNRLREDFYNKLKSLTLDKNRFKQNVNEDKVNKVRKSIKDYFHKNY